MQGIEVRAFGCLLEELLSRCVFREDQADGEASLWDLQKSCMAEAVQARPDFPRIHRELEEVTAEIL